MFGARRIAIIGSTGLLGEALREAALASGACLDSRGQINSRALLSDLRQGRTQAVRDLVASSDDPQDWIFAAGLVDPQRCARELIDVNCDGPRLLFDALRDAASAQGRAPASLRLVTIGSVLEDRAELQAVNAYIASKAALTHTIGQAVTQDPRGLVGWHHLKLHTLYGRKEPHSCMFLGQMAAALREVREFSMSSGRQLREYHQVDDAADGILSYLASATDRIGVATPSNGRVTSLAELAGAVFDHFGHPELLKVGALPDQVGEVYMPIAETARPVSGRDPVAGIITWLEEIGIRRQGR